MGRIAAYHMRIGVLYVLVGMGIGIMMGISGDHTLRPAHAHLNLAGFVVTFLYGLFMRPFADEKATWLEWSQLALAHAGAIVMNIGVTIIYSGNEPLGERFAAPGSLVTAAGMLLFAVIVYRRTAVR